MRFKNDKLLTSLRAGFRKTRFAPIKKRCTINVPLLGEMSRSAAALQDRRKQRDLASKQMRYDAPCPILFLQFDRLLLRVSMAVASMLVSASLTTLGRQNVEESSLCRLHRLCLVPAFP